MMKSLRRLKVWWLDKPQTALLVFAVCLLAVEGIVRIPGFWTLDQNSSTGRIPIIVDSAFRRSTNPEIVFLGDSRLQYSVSPLVVAEVVGLPSTEVAIIYIPAGHPFDYIGIYRDNRTVMRNSRLLVMNLSAGAFNWGLRSSFNNRFRHRATLSQRIETPEWQDKVDRTTGWFWRTWDARVILRGYMNNILTMRISVKGKSFRPRPVPLDELHRNVSPKQLG